MRLPSIRRLSQAAWSEWKIGKSAQGQATEPLLGTEHPPRGFIETELGYGFGEGPSLSATLSHFEFEAKARPKREAYQKKQRRKSESGNQKQARLKAILGQ